MSEKEIEQALVKAVRAAGGMCPKWVAVGMNGFPDRMILLPQGRIAFAEIKAPGKKPRRLQTIRHQQLRILGFKVYVIDAPEQIPAVIKEVQA
jgi:hypothetical protein